MIAHESLKIYTWQDVMSIARFLADRIAADGLPDLIVGIPRGGMLVATLLAELLNRDLLALYVSRRENGEEVRESPILKCPIPAELVRGKHVLLVDEIAVTGQTIETAKMLLEELGTSEVRTCVLVDRSNGACVCRYRYAITLKDCNIFPWDYLVRCESGDYCVHPEYQAMDETLRSDLYEDSATEPPDLPQEPLKGLSTLFLAAIREHFGDVLLSVYLYGSALGEDYAARSDVDFVVLLRMLPVDAEDRVCALHYALAEKHPAARTLEGGYHVVENGSASGRRLGIWVNEQGRVERCDLEIEPDSAKSIIDSGMILWGPALEHWLPRPEETELCRFSKRYLLEYGTRLPERLSSAKHFFSSVLNACRSICYCIDGVFLTKTAAARRVEELIPNGKDLLEKALAYRNGTSLGEYTDGDILACEALIFQSLKIITQRGVQ